MFTVKLMKYAKSEDGAPTATDSYSIREAKAVHVRYEADLRTVLQLNDAPGETDEFTIGDRPHCSYNVAYVMNPAGKTVDTIR